MSTDTKTCGLGCAFESRFTPAFIHAKDCPNGPTTNHLAIATNIGSSSAHDKSHVIKLHDTGWFCLECPARNERSQ